MQIYEIHGRPDYIAIRLKLKQSFLGQSIFDVLETSMSSSRKGIISVKNILCFNWKKKLDTQTIAHFQTELGKMGYKFQFVTLAGFHVLNLSMFELARDYRETGMSAYSQLQEIEFARESDSGYRAVKHQAFVGTGYFDAVAQVIAGGLSSTVALSGSTEEEQFTEECTSRALVA